MDILLLTDLNHVCIIKISRIRSPWNTDFLALFEPFFVHVFGDEKNSEGWIRDEKLKCNSRWLDARLITLAEYIHEIYTVKAREKSALRQGYSWTAMAAVTAAVAAVAEMPEGHFENLWFDACVPVHSASDGARWTCRRLWATAARRNGPCREETTHLTDDAGNRGSLNYPILSSDRRIISA